MLSLQREFIFGLLQVDNICINHLKREPYYETSQPFNKLPYSIINIPHYISNTKNVTTAEWEWFALRLECFDYGSDAVLQETACNLTPRPTMQLTLNFSSCAMFGLASHR